MESRQDVTELTMSYSIFIGNAKPEYPSEKNDYSFGWKVEAVSHPDAPEWEAPDQWPDISGKSNGRHPGYGQFHEFCDITGLHELFTGDEEGLLRSHPGIASLNKNHLAVIHTARTKWQQSHPGATPGWKSDQDPIFARLIWYEWWMIWALENCEYPAVQNY